MQTKLSIVVPALLLAAACGGSDAPRPKSTSASTSPVAAPSTAPAEDPQQQFAALCSACHGTAGKGDGPGAAALEPKPRAFSDVAWQDSVTDDHLKKVIVYGGAAAGKSAMMPAQPQLKGNAAALDGLVKIIRGFRNK